MTPRMVVTGFAAFPGAPVNPTERLVRDLDTATIAARSGVDIHAEILPVEYAAVARRLPELWNDIKPLATIHFGLAMRSRMLRIERAAHNRMSTRAGDAAGIVPSAQAIDPRGPSMRSASLPAHQIAQQLRICGLEVRISRAAGAYLCNFASYLSLGLAGKAMTGFVHVPLPAELDAPRAPADRPSWAELEAAVATVVATVAGHIAHARAPAAATTGGTP